MYFSYIHKIVDYIMNISNICINTHLYTSMLSFNKTRKYIFFFYYNNIYSTQDI